MSMRVGSVNGQTVKRVRKNSKDTTLVQPVRKEVVPDFVDEHGQWHQPVERLVNDGEQFVIHSSLFLKHKI